MAEKRKDNKGRNLRLGETQRADGRYMFRCKNNAGKTVCIYSMDLAELREKEKQLLKDIDEGIQSNKKILLNDMFDEYMAGKPR